METLSFLLLPFIGCLLLILLHTYFGLHVLERGIIFVDLSLAQFISIGIALSFFTGNEAHALSYALLFAVLGAAILSLARSIAKFVNIEAFIGVLYIFSFAASILILDKTPHGAEELKEILNGSILWVTGKELVQMAVLYAVLGLFHFIFRKKFLALSYDGKGGTFWEFLFFLSFAVMLVNSIRIAGILQVFSFLIIPALIGRLFTREPSRILVWGWIIGILASIFGTGISYKLDFPTAPLIVASLSMAFFMALGFKIWNQMDVSLKNQRQGENLKSG